MSLYLAVWAALAWLGYILYAPLPTPIARATGREGRAIHPISDLRLRVEVLMLQGFLVGLVVFAVLIVAKLIRAASTPGRAGARQIQSLNDALFVLGYDGAYTLSLGFILLGAWDTRALEPVWRRSVIAGEAGREIAADLGIPGSGEAYLGALLQDIGRLAMRQVIDGYDATFKASNNEALVKHEKATWGTTHAEVGAWLAEHWGLSTSIVDIIRRSHDVPSPDEGFSAVHCVALSGRVADLFLIAGDELRIAVAQRAAYRIAGYEQEDIDRLVCALAAKISEAESVFQCELVDSTVRAMLDSAKELLQIRCVAE